MYEPITTMGLRRAVTNVQKRIEGDGFDARKSLLEYDDVAQLHRLAIYKLRENALCGQMNLDEYYLDVIPIAVDALLEPYFTNEIVNMDGVVRDVGELTCTNLCVSDIMHVNSQAELRNLIIDYVIQSYHKKIENPVLNRVADGQRFAIVNSIDKLWVTKLLQ